MEAASRGANEAGGHVIGSTCTQLEEWRNVKANDWVKEEWRFATLRERMYALIDNCDAAIIMPGGVGTLAELAVMWNEEIISPKSPRVMVLVGKGWQKTIAVFLEEFYDYVHQTDQKRVYFAEDINSANAIINQFNQELIATLGHNNGK
jgi:predicted Rossmann-fold nucleotide-binding protein